MTWRISVHSEQQNKLSHQQKSQLDLTSCVVNTFCKISEVSVATLHLRKSFVLLLYFFLQLFGLKGNKKEKNENPIQCRVCEKNKIQCFQCTYLIRNELELCYVFCWLFMELRIKISKVSWTGKDQWTHHKYINTLYNYVTTCVYTCH